MNRLLALSVAVFLFGCPKNTSNDPDATARETDPTAAEATPPRPPPVSADTAAPAETPPSPAPPPSDGATAQDDSGGGRMAKPGWCKDDKDCSEGKVCEACGGEGSCVPGCHTSAQCKSGEFCNQVQCIRCPCPGICEPKGNK